MEVFHFSDFVKSGELFLQKLVQELNELGIDSCELKPDHLCFRVETQSEYDYYKSHLSSSGKLLTEATVNGRAICTFKLSAGFASSLGEIKLVELPSPKTGSNYKTGFEHAEFVIQESFQKFQSRHPRNRFNISGSRNLNPELCLKTKYGQAKFHPCALDRVIEIEEAPLTDIIFDFDGTLIQSREQIYKINAQVFSAICQREVSLTEAKEKFSPEFEKLFLSFQVEDPELQKQAVILWGEASSQFDFPLFEGARELLEELRHLGYRLHLWTARDPISAQRILASHRIQDLFNTLSFADSQCSKPAASSLLLEWQTAPKNSLLVLGDSPTDIQGAKNIQAIAAAALWDAEASIDALAAHGAELFFYNLNQFRQWILQGR